MRLFLAIDLPDEILENLSRLGCEIQGAHWLPQNQLHLTLRFIGQVDEGKCQDICEGLSEVSYQKFSIRLQGVGCFPLRGEPKVVWAGIAPNPELLSLREKIDSALFRIIGLEPEQKMY